MSKEDLRDKILQLVGQFGEDNFIGKPFKEGDVIPPSGKVIGASELKMMTNADFLQGPRKLADMVSP